MRVTAFLLASALFGAISLTRVSSPRPFNLSRVCWRIADTISQEDPDARILAGSSPSNSSRREVVGALDGAKSAVKKSSKTEDNSEGELGCGGGSRSEGIEDETKWNGSDSGTRY
ncbi:hypothetical protein DFH09DRAFT_1099438 [Mycena vulgaris]|nr:hypothetical protein DFH09DRAFT_1099438 [Mycena vulgaris]